MRILPAMRRGVMLVVLVLLLSLLGACSSGNIRTVPTDIPDASSFGLIIQAYKNGRFVVDGGVVLPAALDSHLAYLESQQRLPETVLLEDGSESSVRGGHLREFARLQAKFGFQAYVEHDGKFERLHPDP